MPPTKKRKAELVDENEGKTVAAVAAAADAVEGTHGEDAVAAAIIEAADAAAAEAKEEAAEAMAAEAEIDATSMQPLNIIPVSEATAAWNQMLFELLLYKAKHGDFNVRQADEQNKMLHMWMQQQRKAYKVFQSAAPEDGSLTQDQVAVLESLNFAWNTRGDEHWKRNYEKLKAYQQEHGHTLVPRHSPVPKLGDWVTEQRRQFKAQREGKPTLLTKERIQLLDQLGFVWQVRQRTGWQDRFDQLVAYKAKYGDTIVPQHYAEDRALGKWVAKQREQYRLLQLGKHSFLTPDRVQALKSIDFVWSVKGRSPKDVVAEATGSTPKKDAAPATTTAPATTEGGDVAAATGGTEVVVAAAAAAVVAEAEGKEDGASKAEETKTDEPAGPVKEETKEDVETKEDAVKKEEVEATNTASI